MAKKIKKYKVGLESETYAISLVESPAIEETLVALEEQKEIKVQLANEEKHMVYSAVLVPDKPIYRRNEDGDEYYVEFTKESIEHMSQQFFKEYKQNEITLDHETTASDITVVESWLKSDLYKDKSVALGLNPDLPVGTWFAGMKVNQIDAWERVKDGSLKGFSVESLIRLEEFSKEEKNDNNMTNEIESMNFWKKMKEVLQEVFNASKNGEIEPVNEIDLAKQSGFTNVEDYKKEVEAIKEELEEQNPAPTPEPTPEPVSEPSEPVAEPEPTVTPEPTPEPVTEPQNEPVEAPKNDNAHLEELINNLKSEIEALKGYNSELQNKVKDMEKQPSTQPVNVNAKPSAGDTYSAWREQMRGMINRY